MKNLWLIVVALLAVTAGAIVSILGLLALGIIWLVVGVVLAGVFALRYRRMFGSAGESEGAAVKRLEEEVGRTQDITEGLMVDRSRLKREVSRLEDQKEELPTRRTSGQICDPGPYLLEGGEIRYIELDVRPREYVQGRIEERDGDDFDWYIVDEENLVLAKGEENFEDEAGDDHVPAAVVDWQVPTDGPWFLILSLYRRQNDREIAVHLRRD